METEKKTHVSRREILKQYKKKTPMQEVLSRFMHNRLAVLGLIIFTIILLLAIFADQIADYQNVALKMNIRSRLQGPSAEHWFGTDEAGRDVFARVIHGSRTSLWIGFAATFMALLGGGTLGAIAGYFGKFIDELIMRIMDIMMCLPGVLLAMAIVSAFGSSALNMIIAIAVSRLPRFARVVRSSVLTVRTEEYIESARAIGAKSPRIITRHILINCMGPIIVQIALVFASSVLAISALSFLGLGIKPPAPEWGNMLAAGRAQMRDHANLVLAPGLALFFSIFSLNLLGDGLRDAFDPKMKK
ncbi:MAG: ABC transporter permease [Clostridia bacterium]|nr:ABC transporter permease [Clostridia bacterium]